MKRGGAKPNRIWQKEIIMFRRGFWRMGIAGFSGSVNSDGVTVLAKNSSDNVIFCSCTTALIPSLTAGYAIGCILINTTSGWIHSNTGTAALCMFQSLSPASGTGATGATA
jgi:hypothetical protein